MKYVKNYLNAGDLRIFGRNKKFVKLFTCLSAVAPTAF